MTSDSTHGPSGSQIDERGVRGFLHRPEHSSGDAIVLTHGAGANCRSALLVALAVEFCSRGFVVLRYDLPFRQLRSFGPPSPGSAERDQQGVSLAIDFIRRQSANRIFAGGHSYGGRQTTMLAASQPGICDGLLLLSYPLHPPKSPKQVRTTHFPNLHTPALFVHGSRDGFGSIEEMTSALELIPAQTRLVPVESAGHELLSKKNDKELPSAIASAFLDFLGNNSRA